MYYLVIVGSSVGYYTELVNLFFSQGSGIYSQRIFYSHHLIYIVTNVYIEVSILYVFCNFTKVALF